MFALSNIDRGTHQLAVEILDEQDRIVERTANQPFHMQRMSLAQKRRIKPCATADYGQRPECPLAEKPEEEKKQHPAVLLMPLRLAHYIGANHCTLLSFQTHFGSKVPEKAGRTPRNWAKNTLLRL